MADSSPSGNYTSFELWPVFLTLSTPGFVKNIFYPLRYLCSWYRELINEKLQMLVRSKGDAGGRKVHRNYFPNKTFSVLVFCRWCQILFSLLRLLSFRHLHMNFTLANMKPCFWVFACFAFSASFNAPQLSPLWSFLSKQECTVWVGLLLALACVGEWGGGAG